jgi:xanthine dehydrogenase accessory factor
MLEIAVDGLLREVMAGASPGGRARDAGTRELPVEGSSIRVYLERSRPVPGLLIVGAGHLAEPLHRQGALLGFRVTVIDDRPDFAQAVRFPDADRVIRVDFSDPFATIPPSDRTHVVLVTRGHRYDYECLRRLLREERRPEYIGMIGSRRRVRATFHQLLEDGVSVDALSGIRAPIGLDVGAETPAEIAVSAAAEWVKLARGGTGRPLIEVERIAERFFGDPAPTAMGDPQ